MSIGREMYYESIADNAYYEHRVERALSNEVWITRDGREIPVCEMSDGHLANCIRMMLRGGSGCFYGVSGDVLEMLTDEASRRGLAVER